MNFNRESRRETTKSQVNQNKKNKQKELKAKFKKYQNNGGTLTYKEWVVRYSYI